jgi:hypothetical protein
MSLNVCFSIASAIRITIAGCLPMSLRYLQQHAPGQTCPVKEGREANRGDAGGSVDAGTYTEVARVRSMDGSTPPTEHRRMWRRITCKYRPDTACTGWSQTQVAHTAQETLFHSCVCGIQPTTRMTRTTTAAAVHVLVTACSDSRSGLRCAQRKPSSTTYPVASDLKDCRGGRTLASTVESPCLGPDDTQGERARST